MPVTRVRRGRTSGSKLMPDQAQHLVSGWAIDPCLPYFGTPGFPFKSPEVRERRWIEHRADLVKAWGPVERMAAWRDYDADDEQRAAFDLSKAPDVWGWRSKHGDDGELPRKVADVIPMPEEATDD